MNDDSDIRPAAPRVPASRLELLDEIRAIAQLGLNYTRDPFDLARYERLLAIAAGEYSGISGLPIGTLMERFRAEVGHVTPRVGVDAAIFSPAGELLLMKRSDDGLWCLPCGWAEIGESPQEAIRREVWEETGLEVEVGPLIELFYRRAGDYLAPHAGYFLLFHCVPVGGRLTETDEAPVLGYTDYRRISEWHRDHRKRAERAVQFLQSGQSASKNKPSPPEG